MKICEDDQNSPGRASKKYENFQVESKVYYSLCSKFQRILTRFDLSKYKNFSPADFFNGRTLKTMKESLLLSQQGKRGITGSLGGLEGNTQGIKTLNKNRRKGAQKGRFALYKYPEFSGKYLFRVLNSFNKAGIRRNTRGVFKFK